MALNEERKRTEARPKTAPTSGYLVLKEQRITRFDARAAELLEVQEPTGLRLFELLVPESWNEVRIAIEQVRRGERNEESSIAQLRDADKWIHVAVESADPSGEILLRLQPLQTRGKADADGTKSRDHFHALVKNSSEGFTIFNENAEIVYESPANKRIHGYDPHEVMGRSLFDFCVKEDRAQIMPLFENLKPGGHATGTVRFRHKNGHYIFLEGTIHHQLDHPSIRGIINNFRDISSRVEAESELRRAKEAAEDAIEVQKRFLANISHELKTPLTLIRQPLYDLQKATEASTDPQLRHLWPMVGRNLDQLDRLISELLDLSQLEAGLFRLQAQQLDLAAFLGEFVSVFGPAAEAKGIALETELPSAAVAFFDPGKIEKAVRNLLANALKFTEAGGRIRLRLRLPDGETMNPQYTIEVEDTGCGMDELTRERAFDRFYQAESGDARRYEGLGIGLALARAMTRMHGGELTLRSQPAIGSTFILTLPVGCWHLAPEEIEILDDPPRRAPVPAIPPAAAPSSGESEGAHRHHLLLVEDNPDMRSYLAHHLGELYELSQAANGQEALDLLDGGGIDLVVSDVMMPTLDGLELCRRMQSKKHLSNIPLILLSAKSTGQERTAGLEAGASDYISKPFFMPKVLIRIQHLLAEDPLATLHPADKNWLETASANIREILAVQDLTIEDMARVSGMAPDSFERKLRGLTGESPRTFLRNLRLQHADRLLIDDPAKPVEAIASEVGMTPDLLRRAYRSHFGKEPGL